MTDEEAIKQLKKCKSFHNGSYGAAINLAIKALEQIELNPSYNGVKTELESCEDCISRTEAIKALQKVPCSLAGVRIRFILSIKDLPSVTPSYNSIKTELAQTRWIPVSERLPKAFEFVNCTCHSLIDNREDWVIETVYVPQPSNSPYSDWGNIPMLNSGDCKVVAWMRRDIPEPYKAESEDKE